MSRTRTGWGRSSWRPRRASRGYLGDPPPATPATERVRTGDLGRLDEDGRLFVVDRRLDRIVRGGENIAPAEVEAVLLAHPAIADAAVVGLADPLWGHVPAAAIVLAEGAPDPGDESLTAHCRASLAGFKVPVSFLRLDALPRTSGGKLRREAVRALLAGERTGELARPDGACIGWRVTGEGSLPLLLLHGTLSNAQQLDRLAATLARPGDITVHALDRRGSGTGRLAPGAPIARAGPRGPPGGHRRVPGRAADRAGGGRRRQLRRRAGRSSWRRGTRIASRRSWRTSRRTDRWPTRRRGPPSGPWPGPPPTRTGPAAPPLRPRPSCARSRATPPGTGCRTRSRAFLAREGDGAAADAALAGARPEGLASITAPVTILTGGASEPFYGPIADALAVRIPGARRDTLDGLSHPSPITQPTPVAAASARRSRGRPRRHRTIHRPTPNPPSAHEPSAATDPEPPA